MKISYLPLFFLLSCSALKKNQSPREGKYSFSYTDLSGDFRYLREIKSIGKKVITRTQILLPSAGADRIVEKSVAVSQKGSVRDGMARTLVFRPLASEFTVWLEGKKYFSRMQIDPKTKSMKVSMDSPEPKWQGRKDFPFPRGKYFCFYSQIPDCLYHNQILSRAFENKKRTFDFFVIWDNYPYVQDQLTGVGKNLFAHATLKYDGEPKGRIRYIIEVEEQVLLYQFTKNYELAGSSWIAQGINMVKPGEEVKTEEE